MARQPTEGALREALEQHMEEEMMLGWMTPEERSQFLANKEAILREVEEADSWEPLLRRLRERS